MNMSEVAARGLILLGCGRMGSALLEGWLHEGLPPSSVHVIDPNPSERLRELEHQELHLNKDLPDDAAIALIAVKPQMMGEALPALRRLGGGNTLFITVAAGTSFAQYEKALGDVPIVRAMPNTPAAIGRGITAIVGNDRTTAVHLDLADELLQAVGQTVRLEDEAQIDAVIGVSGSGPAYVFHLIEALAKAGEDQGLSPELSLHLAKATVAGAGALAEQSPESPARLRENVTSPNGTTFEALKVLMDEQTGFPPLLRRAVAASADRSRELGREA
jgi:pyrroline-5-carboxylate reductase